MKYKAKTKDCRLELKAKVSFGEIINSREFDRFARVYFRGFLKPTLVTNRKAILSGPIAISLYERLMKPIDKKEFFMLLEQLVLAVRKLETNHFSINHLVTNIQNTFINQVTKEVQFLYVPLECALCDSHLPQFLESIVYSARPVSTVDADAISRFVYFYRTMRTFDINAIEKYIAHEDKAVVNILLKQNAGQSGFMTSHKKYPKADDESTGLLSEKDESTGMIDDAEADYEDATGLLEEENPPPSGLEDGATGLLTQPEDGATGLLSVPEDGATGLLSEPEDSAIGLLSDEGTGLLVEESFPNKRSGFYAASSIHFPSLLRLITNETIQINKPVFRLGKEKSYVDYFVTNNVAVSRSHADIITRGTRYFVTDLNSKNHTYINDHELPIHSEVEIKAGDKLRLGNEEFIFQG